MRIGLVLALLALLAVCAAAASLLEEGTRRDAAYQDALRGVTAAMDDLRKVEGDPGAPVMTVLVAREALAEAEAQLRLSRATAHRRALEAAGDLLAARRKETVGIARRDLAAVQLQASALRLNAGAISQQEYARAQEVSARAEAALLDDIRSVQGAETRARAVLGEIPLLDPGEPPVLDVAASTIDEHVRLLAARHRLAAATRALALAQGPDTAPLDRAARERELAGTEDALEETERVLRDGLETATRRYQLAWDHHALAEQSYALARDDHQMAIKRHEAGAIARVALLEAALAEEEAALARQQALNEYWQAHYAVFEATGGAQ